MFLFNATATTDIYPDWHTLPLHDALPIWKERLSPRALVIRRPLSEACCTTRLPRTATPLIGGAGTSSLSTVAARARAGRPRPAQVLRWQPRKAIPAAAFRLRTIL